MRNFTLKTGWLGCLLLTLLMGGQRAAWAGHWNITCSSKNGGVQYAWQYTPHYPPYGDGATQGDAGTFTYDGEVASVEPDAPGPFINGHAHIAVTPLVTLTWQRDSPSDEPPKKVCYVENATAWADAWTNAGWTQQPVPCTPTANNGGSLGGTNLATYPETTSFEFGQMQAGRYLNQAKVTGDTVVLPSRTMTADIVVPACQAGGGQFRAVTLYSVDIVNVAISANIARSTVTVARPDYQEWNAYLKQDYKLNDNGDALEPFWSGAGSYAVIAKKQDWTDIFSNQQYEWSVAGSGQPYIPAPYPPEDEIDFLPAGSISAKNFNLDFGQSNDGFAKDSTVTAYVTGDNGSKVGPLKVVVHWYLPRWFVTKAAPVTTGTGPHDPDKSTGPVDPPSNPDDPDYVDMQTIALYVTARTQFIQRGATYVKNALELEKAIADFYATGPIYELGAAALEGVIAKAGEALQVVGDLRAFATKATEEAANLRRLA